MKTMLILLALLAISVAIGPVAFAQDDGGDPAEAGENLKVTVLAVDGDSDYLPVGGGEDDWTAVTVGTVMMAGAQIWTYDKSSVGLEFGDNSLVTVQQNTNVIIDQFFYDKNQDSIVTDVRVKSGNVRIKVKESAVKTDMQIITPNATASVTGTDIRNIVTRRGFSDKVGLAEGSIKYKNSFGSSTTVSGGQNAKASDTKLVTAMMTAQQERFTDVLPQGLSGNEIDAAVANGAESPLLPGDHEGSANPYFSTILAREALAHDLGSGGRSFDDPPPMGSE